MSFLFNNSAKLFITFGDKEYYNIEDIPDEQFSMIHTIKDCHPKLLKNPLFNKIKNCCNLRFISFVIEYYDTYDKIFTEEIANFQNLSVVIFIDYGHFDFRYVNNQKYINNNKMIIFNPTEDDFNNIPSHVEYLNIVNEKIYDYTNIPNNIRFLHLSTKHKCFKLTNLPYSLETITFTILKIFKDYITFQDIENNIKLPFNCKIIVEYV